jgi:hypothetical protein
MTWYQTYEPKHNWRGDEGDNGNGDGDGEEAGPAVLGSCRVPTSGLQTI